MTTDRQRLTLPRSTLRVAFITSQLLACGGTEPAAPSKAINTAGQPSSSSPTAGRSSSGTGGASRTDGASGAGVAAAGESSSGGSPDSGQAGGGASSTCAPAPTGPIPAGFTEYPIPAFPGAEGFGAWSRGGRGGDVYRVTSLASAGPGSLLDAIESSPATGRTIVFAVSGHIRLLKNAKIKKFVTIAGQTAPGGGIVVTNHGLWANDHDIIIRHIRMRVGREGSGDAMDSIGAAANLMLDHCEYMFSRDENFSNFGAGTPNLTDQWAINAWGLQAHSAGGLWAMKHVSSHHSLWANNHTRNPKVIDPDVFDWANNLTFGWDIGMNLAGADAAGVYRANIRSSTFFHGGGAKEAVFGGGGPVGSDVLSYTAYVSDTAFDGVDDGVFAPTRRDYGVFSGDPLAKINQAPAPFSQTLDGSTTAEVLGVPVHIDDRLTAFKKVLSQAGALRLDVAAPALRDELSQKAIDGVVAGKRQIIADPLELGVSNGEANLEPGVAPADSDADGMPDDWETTLGFDAKRASHDAVFSCAEVGTSFLPVGSPAGYTHLEEYLHFLAVPHATLVVGSPEPTLEVDLRRFTAGFTASPSFTLSRIRAGKATQSGPGGALVSFSPSPSYVGRAGLEFTVTDADGSTWTQQLAILVRPQTSGP